MKKIWKITKVIVLIAVILFVGAISAFYIMFPQSKIKSMAQNYVRENYKREITFDRVYLTLIGIKIINLKVSEENTFENGNFIEAKQVVLKADILPLLRGKIKIKKLILDGIKVNIIKDTDGKFNFDSFLTQGTTTEKQENKQNTEGEETISAFDLIADIISLQNSSFTYLDKETNMHFGIDNLNLTIQNFSLTDLFTFTLNLDTNLKMGDITVDPLSINLGAQANLAGLNLKNAYINLMP